MTEEMVLLEKIYEEQKKMQEQLSQVEEQVREIPEIKEQIRKIPEMEEELHRISGSVARIEVEHGEKLVALFDAFKLHSEKFKSEEEKINSCQKQLDKHDDEIYFLKSKVRDL